MFSKIKNKIDKELVKFVKDIDKRYFLNSLSPLLFQNIKEFILREGKRIRPILFVIGYLGFAKKEAPNLYRSAASIELLHDFMLVHDDIIDKSDMRRGKPSMHKMLNNYLKRYTNNKFTGQDLAIVVGDIMYAMAIDAFLSIKENVHRKENALKKFIEATIYTGGGEFIELILGLKDLKKISKQDIYKVYDCKTAYYTFTSPLITGATLAGASSNQIAKLFEYGICLGRAFQINDDILGMFGEESKTGKSSLTDLQESKKTLLIWQAYNKSDNKNKKIMEKILSKKNITSNDLKIMRKIIIKSTALTYAKDEIYKLTQQAYKINNSSKMCYPYKEILATYPKMFLEL